MAAINLKTAFGQWDPTRTLSQMGHTIATAKAQFPVFYAKWQGWSRTDANFLKLTWASVTANEKSWAEGGCNIDFPEGVPIMVSDQIRWPYGGVTGSGIFIDPQFDTILKVADVWAGDPAKRSIMVSPSFGNNSLLGYHEGAFMDKMRFDGNRKADYRDASYESSGVVGWDFGESSAIDRIKSDWFNDFGVLLARATPAHIRNLSAFGNARAGVGLAGTALGTVRIDLLTGDDNKAMFEMFAAYDREPGGNLTIGTIKCESATIPERTLHPHQVFTGQPVGILRGQFNVVIDNMSFASGHVRSAQLFWIDDRLTTGSPQASRLKVSGKGFGYAALVVHSNRGIYFDAPPDYTAFDAVYDTKLGRLWINGEEQAPKPFLAGSGPMSFARAGETLNFATATPQQVGNAVPPPVTPPVTPPVPPPVTSPPTGTVIATVPAAGEPTPFTNTKADFKRAVTWKGATSFAFTGLKASSLSSKFIACRSDGRGVVLAPDGAIWWVDTIIKPAGTVKMNTAVDVTVTFPATDFVQMGDSKIGSAGNSNAFVGSWTKLTVSK